MLLYLKYPKNYEGLSRLFHLITSFKLTALGPTPNFCPGKKRSSRNAFWRNTRFAATPGARLCPRSSAAATASADGVENLGFGWQFDFGFRDPVEGFQGGVQQHLDISSPVGLAIGTGGPDDIFPQGHPDRFPRLG